MQMFGWARKKLNLCWLGSIVCIFNSRLDCGRVPFWNQAKADPAKCQHQHHGTSSGTSWWFQPIWKIYWSNWIISPSTGENKTCLKAPPREHRKNPSKTASLRLTLLRFFREKHQMISWIPPNLNIAAHSVRWVVCINHCWWRFPETNELPLKMMVGRVSSFWGGLFSGALAVSFQGVIRQSCWSSSVPHTANTELLHKEKGWHSSGVGSLHSSVTTSLQRTPFLLSATLAWLLKVWFRQG